MTEITINRNKLLTEKEAADFICYSQRALQNWRVRGGGPKYVKVSARSIRYQLGDVLDWIEERKRKHTSQKFN